MRAALTLILVVLMISGCSAPAPARSADRPAGFTIDATVRPPASAGPQAGAQPAPRPPRALRPARYLVETDADLRLAIGALVGTPQAGYPPIVRRLSPRQVDQLWLLVRDARLLDQLHPGRISDFVIPPPDPVQATAIFEVSTDFRPYLVMVNLNEATPEAAAARRLLDQLADLAWIPE